MANVTTPSGQPFEKSKARMRIQNTRFHGQSLEVAESGVRTFELRSCNGQLTKTRCMRNWVASLKRECISLTWVRVAGTRESHHPATRDETRDIESQFHSSIGSESSSSQDREAGEFGPNQESSGATRDKRQESRSGNMQSDERPVNSCKKTRKKRKRKRATFECKFSSPPSRWTAKKSKELADRKCVLHSAARSVDRKSCTRFRGH